MLVTGAALCSDATLAADERSGVGDPTEVALVVAARRHGLVKSALEGAHPRVHEYGFDSERKLMTTVHQVVDPTSPFRRLADAGPIAVTKGAADPLRPLLARRLRGSRVPLTSELRERIERAGAALARQGIRVLGVGVRGLDATPRSLDPNPVERELVFVGSWA
jgi:Ca2+-transporting ATPase